MFGHLELGWRPSLIPNQGVGVGKIDLKLYWMIGEGSGRAHSKAETLGNRFHVPRKLANKWLRFEVELKWPGYHFSRRKPDWAVKSTSNFIERSEEGDCGGKRKLWMWGVDFTFPGGGPVILWGGVTLYVDDTTFH